MLCTCCVVRIYLVAVEPGDDLEDEVGETERGGEALALLALQTVQLQRHDAAVDARHLSPQVHHLLASRQTLSRGTAFSATTVITKLQQKYIDKYVRC